jgi:hypothetical protein
MLAFLFLVAAASHGELLDAIEIRAPVVGYNLLQPSLQCAPFIG